LRHSLLFAGPRAGRSQLLGDLTPSKDEKRRVRVADPAQRLLTADAAGNKVIPLILIEEVLRHFLQGEASARIPRWRALPTGRLPRTRPSWIRRDFAGWPITRQQGLGSTDSSELLQGFPRDPAKVDQRFVQT